MGKNTERARPGSAHLFLQTILARAYPRMIAQQRERSWMFFDVFLPILAVSAYVFVYHAIGAPEEYVGFVVMGGAMTAFWMNILWSMSSQLYWEKKQGNLTLYIMAPNSMMAIFLGMALGGMFATTLRALAITLFESRIGQPAIAEKFPVNTYAFFAGTRLDQTWQVLKQAYGSMLGESDFDEALGLLKMQFGLNPDTDLFPCLDGEYALGIVPSTRGILAWEMDAPLGLLLLVESSDEAVLYQLTDSLTDLLFMLFEVEDIDSEDLYGYQAFDFDAQEPSFAFAASKDLLLLGTDLANMQSSLSRNNPLTENSRYIEALDALPDNIRLGMFVDVKSILDLIEEQAPADIGAKDLGDINLYRPIQSIVSGSSTLEDNLLHGSMLVIMGE